jgi:cholesterol transport system auxiliary component
MIETGLGFASRRRFLALSGAALLPGCSTLLGQTPPHLHMLSSTRSFDADLPTVHWQLVVDPPTAAESLDTVRIALSRGPTQIDYFADSAWTDRAPVMIQGLIIESLENTGKILAVGRFASDLRADYVLQTELRDFEARYANGADALPGVSIRLEAKLVKMPDRQIIGNTNIVQDVPAPRNDIDSIVGAFDDGLGRVLKQLVEWTLRTPR